MRHPRILGTGPLCYYHALSRVIERRFIFDVQEREYFQKTMRAQEAFCGVRVLTWTCLSNHFHILVAVPDRASAEVRAEIGRLIADDDAFLARVKCLYTGQMFDEIQARLQLVREGGAKEEAKLTEIEAIKRPYLERMYDLSAFVGEIKQRISQWYNGKNGRTGPLWEDRFKSVLVQGEQGVLATVAAYIDLNAVRAGIVQDPRQWRWCGYAEAAAAQGRSRQGICEILDDASGGLQDGAVWKGVHRRYRALLLTEGRGCCTEADEFSNSEGRGLHQRVRYLGGGLALGSESFVEQVFLDNQQRMRVKRKTGARVPPSKCGLGSLRTLLDLRGAL